MTRASAKPASRPRRCRAQGQLRARQSGCRSESGSPGVHCLPLDLARAEVMFDGLKILTAPGLVMTPVPTTEALVQCAAEWIGSRSVRVADVGTGSGAVAVALALRAPAARIWATDDSEPAVALARANVARHGLDERVRVLLGDLLDPVPGVELDFVVANLPYHAEARARGPAESACCDQPAHAIYAPGDGLGYYRELIEVCRTRLNGGGALAIQLYGSVLAAGRGQLDQLAHEIEIRAHAGWESRVAAGSGERRRRWSAYPIKRAAA
jgi:HemK-like putative methylase